MSRFTTDFPFTVSDPNHRCARSSVRISLKTTTALAALAGLLVAAAPNLALANDECGTAQAGSVVCQGANNPYETGIRYEVQPPASPQDLTIHLDDDVAIVTLADDTSAVTALNNTGGSVTISGSSGATISTAGARSAGVNASANLGDVTVEVGDVYTSGYRANGIDANSNDNYGSGNVTVKAGTVTTTGYSATGIRSQTQDSDIEITANGVYAFGYGSGGVYVNAHGGNATVNVGHAATYGQGGVGLAVYSKGVTTVNAIGVYTRNQSIGDQFSSSGIVAVGTQVNVTADIVQTIGDYSAAVVAHTNHQVFDSTVVNPDINVNIGDIQTRGFYSAGIVVQNFAEHGDANITVHSIKTLGDYSRGVYVESFGDVTVNAGSIVTAGILGTGVDAVSVLGNIDVNVGTIHTSGIAGYGVKTVNYSEAGTTHIVVGDLSTTRDYAHGISSEAYGDITITSDKLVTNGLQAYGISAISIYGDVSVTSNEIKTHGDHASAISTISYNSGTTINAKKIEVYGDFSSGIYALGAGGLMSIHADEVVTHGDRTVGIGVINFSDAGVTLNAGNVTTSGAGGQGILAVGYGGEVNVTVGTVKTTGGAAQGDSGIGVEIGNHDGDIIASLGSISTTGQYAVGVVSDEFNGKQNVVVDSISTTGDFSQGATLLQVVGQGTFSAKNIVTAGKKSTGIFGIASLGNLTLNVSGGITTSGDDSHGVMISAESFGISPDPYYGETEPVIYDGTATLNINAITTTGKNSNGIEVTTSHTGGYYADSPLITHAIQVQTGTINVTGDGSKGMHIDSLGLIKVDAGTTSSATAEAIDLRADKTVTLNIRGATISKATDAVVVSGAEINASIASTGSIKGVTSGIVLSAGTLIDAYAAIPAYTSGAITLSNAGAISTGTDYGIRVTRGQIALTNSGIISGAVAFADGNDTFTNTGTFSATKDSDFGAGNDTFVNSGTVAIAFGVTQPATVTFLGLEHFENKGGLVDLRNGHAGDSLVLPGTYVASGDARLGLDVSGTANDTLVVGGTATGKTTILLAGLTPATASLTSGTAPTLVRVGTGSTATFELGNADMGMIHYGLKFNATTNSYALASEAGTSVYGNVKLTEGVQSAWQDSAGAWSSHLANLRGDAWGNGQIARSKGNVWVQAYGSTNDRKDDIGTVSTDYEQTNSGVQIGSDLVHTARFVWGVTGGFAKSKLEFDGTSQKADISTLNVGGYVSTTFGGYFVNGLVKYDHHQIKASDGVAVYSESLDANSYGLQAEIGRRFGSDTFAVEPLASLSYVKSSLDDLKVYSQTLSFEDTEGLVGKVGARFSGKHQLKSGNAVVFTAGVAAVQNFSGDQKLTFQSGGVSQDISSERDGAYGQATLGVSYKTAKGLVTYVEGNGDFGGGNQGTGIRLGARLPF